MASYDRRITLYINGQQVQNDVRSIRAEMTRLINEQSRMTIGSDEYVRHARAIQQLGGILAQHRQQIAATTSSWSFRGAVDGVGRYFGAIALGIASISGVKSLVTNIMQVRKEFEKYEAVLTNTLGSNKKARQEMQMLQDFAAETPFAMTELTGSFVKLANYGLKPTRDEMRKYGDLASSVGKGFDQLAEGVADAVTGEFERLKEFGIKAKKEGDKITFTFKEQSTVVDNNATSIKKYITGLGDMQGVAGSMTAIAGTLGGKISNMGDAWDGLMNNMGSRTSGVMVSVIGWMTGFVNTMAYSLKSIKDIKEAVRDKAVTDGMNNALMEIDTMTKNLVKNGVTQVEAHKRAVSLYNQSVNETIKTTQNKLKGATDEQKVQLERRLFLLTEEKNAVAEHYVELGKIKKPSDAGNKGKDDSKEKNNGAQIKLLDNAASQRRAAIKEEYTNGITNEVEFNSKMLVANLAYLEAKKQLLIINGSDIGGIEEEIASVRLKMVQDNEKYLQDEYDKTSVIEKENVESTIQSVDDSIEKIREFQQSALEANLSLFDEYSNLEPAFQDLFGSIIDGSHKFWNEQGEITEAGAALFLGLTSAISGSFSQMLFDQETSLADFLQNTLVIMLSALEQMLTLYIAQNTIKNIATLGPFGLIKAAAEIALMTIAFEGAKALIMGGSKKKAAGGYLNGETLYTVAEAGPEWIAPNWQLKDPRTRPLIGMLESFRQAGSSQRVTLNPKLLEMTSNSTNSGRYPTSNNQSVAPDNIEQTKLLEVVSLFSEELKTQRTMLVDELKVMRSQPMKAEVAAYGGRGSIMDALNRLEAWRKLVK